MAWNAPTRRALLGCAFAAFSLASSPDAALAWGSAAHRMTAGLVSQSLPLELPQFLRSPEAARQIGEVAREPDRSKGAGDPYDSDAGPAHHVDVGDDLKISRGPLLSALPATRELYDTALRAAGSNEYRAGYLPYAIIDGWQRLVVDLAYWRADVAGAKNATTPSERTWFLKDQYTREGMTIRDLGIWAHFVADASQPMNVSVHSEGWGNFPNPEKFSTAKDVRARFESTVLRSHIVEKDVAALLAPIRDCRCTIQRRVSDYLSATQREVVALYRLEKLTGFADNHAGGKAFVSQRLAAATVQMRDLIVDAWRRSAEISVGNPATPLRDIESGKTNALNALQGID